MARDLEARVRRAAESVLTDTEQVGAYGECWAAQRKPKVPLLFLGRRRYNLALTDRRVFVFARRRGGPDAADLVLGKRYNTYEIERVRRGLVHLQVLVQAQSGTRMVFEFRRTQRTLGTELVDHLQAGSTSEPEPEPATAPAHIPPMEALLETPAPPRSAAPSANPPTPDAPSTDAPSTDAPSTDAPRPERHLSRKERRRLARAEEEELVEPPPNPEIAAEDSTGFWGSPK